MGWKISKLTYEIEPTLIQPQEILSVKIFHPLYSTRSFREQGLFEALYFA